MSRLQFASEITLQPFTRECSQLLVLHHTGGHVVGPELSHLQPAAVGSLGPIDPVAVGAQ